MPGGKKMNQKNKNKQQEQQQSQPKQQKEKEAPAPKKAASSAPKPAASAAKGKGKGSKLFGVYVTRLNYAGRSKEDVRSIFKPCGSIADVRIKGDRYIIVWFDKEESAAKAASNLNNTIQKGCTIRVVRAKAQPKTKNNTSATTAYVTNLPGGLTAGQLSNHFKSCGKLVKTRVYAGHYGFLYFRDNKSIAAAKKVAADTPLFGNTVTVRASNRTQKSDRQKDSKRRYEALLLRIGRQRKWTTLRG